MRRARFLLGMSRQFGVMPSAVLNEDAELLQLMAIEEEGRRSGE